MSAGDCTPLNMVGESGIQYSLFEGKFGQKMVLKALHIFCILFHLNSTYRIKEFYTKAIIMGIHKALMVFSGGSDSKESTCNAGDLDSIPGFGRSPAAAAKSLQSCPTLCNPKDGSPPGSAVPGILQARTVVWVAISFSNA